MVKAIASKQAEDADAVAAAKVVCQEAAAAKVVSKTTTTGAFAASTLWSVKMAGVDVSASAQVHPGRLICTVCAAVPRPTKPQRIRCFSLLYY